jgi:hypothetical protein
MADENTEQLRELAEVARRAADEVDRYGTVSRATMDEMSRLQQSTARLVTGTNSLAGAFGRAGTSVDNAADSFERAGRQFSGAVEDGVDAVLAMGSSLYRGEKGAATFNRSIELASRSMQGFVGGITKLIPGLNLVGLGANLSAKALTVLATAATQQADALYNSFSALTKSGGSAADGMSGVFETAKSLGLSMGELSALTDAVGQRAGEFALFGGSVFEARRRLGQMGDALRGSREQFLSLGMTLPDVTEGLANYIALQGRLGRGQTQTTEQLAISARKYLLEQDALTRTLGVTRQQQEQAQQRALVDQQFRAKIQMLRDAGQEEAADRLLQLVTRAAAVGDDVAEGVAAAAAGIYTNENAVKLLMSTMGGLGTVIQDVTTGAQNVDQGFGRLVGDLATFEKNAGRMAALMGTNNDSFTQYDSQIRASIIQQHGFEEAVRRSREEQEKMAPTGGRAQDEMTANQARLMEIQARANETLERFVGEAIVPTQKALITFTDAIADSTEALRKFLFDDDDRQLGATERNITALEENTQALKETRDRLEAARETMPDRIGPRGRRRTNPEVAALEGEVERLEEERRVLERRIKGRQSRRGQRSSGQEVPGFEYQAERSKITPPGAPAAAPQPAAPVAPQAGFSNIITEEELQRQGLKIKPGHTQAPGKTIQQNTVDLAHAVQRAIPGFVRFTGFNDAYPRGEAGASRHPRGAAFDFILDQHPSIAQGRELVQTLRNMGASNALDEYNNRTDRTTAGHIHVEVPLMAKGGITDGVSIAGEAGPEAVVPLPDGKTIPVEINDVTKTVLAGSIDTLNARLAEITGPISLRPEDAMKEGGAGPTFAGYNAWKGYNADNVTTDLGAIKDIAGSLGAFDKATQTITDPKVWQNILQSGIATNVGVGAVEVGTKMGGADIGIDIGERIKEVMTTNNTDLTEALRTVKEEFNSAMLQVIEGMKRQQDPQIQMEILQVLNSINRNQGRTADASQRMADVAMN